MNANERELDYCFAERLPESGATMSVAPGIEWIRMPLPFALDHINLWLLADEHDQSALDGVAPNQTGSSGTGTVAGATPSTVLADAASRAGWTVIDCGIANDISKAHWEKIFDGSLQGAPVQRVFCTHFHPDHFGLADWVCEGGDQRRWQVRLWTTWGEYAAARLFAGTDTQTGTGGASAAEHMRRHGCTDALALEQIAHKAAYYPQLVPSVPARFRRVIDGDSVRIGKHDWRVIVGYGHSPEHAALYSASLNVLIAGDMVLPRISTNVSVFDLEPEGDPLGGFLDSLRRYEDLPADTLVLPSHGKPFRGLPIRLRQLHEHHAARLAEVRQACAEAPCSAADIVPLMFQRKLDTHQMTFALGEALAHLHFLWHRGALTRVQDEAGVYRFAVRTAAV